MRIKKEVFLSISIICQFGSFIIGKMAAINDGSIKVILYMISLAILGVQAFFWQNVLKEYSVAKAYFFYSIAFFFFLVTADFLFREKITGYNIAGLVIISLAMLSISTKVTKK